MLSRPSLHQASTLARGSPQRQSLCLCAALKSFSRRDAGAAYSTSTRRGEDSSSVPTDSLFSPHNSPWDKVFEGIDKSTPMYTGNRRESPSSHHSPYAWRRPVRSQSITAREKNVFQDMFDIVFDAAADIKGGNLPSEAPMFTPVVGTTTQHREMSDLFGRLRKNIKRMRWTSDIDEELDRKKEEIELCDTDVRLLEWATNEVFKPQPTTSPLQEQLTSVQDNQIYPHIIAALMRTLRDKFHDPHLALAIFDHAKNLSILSYVFGCTAPVYNELIETRWFCFHDLKGILDALAEMKVNGVEGDGRTRRIVETIRRDAPAMRLLQEEDYFGKGQDHVMHILTQIEFLVRRPPSPARTTTVKRTPLPEKSWWEGWKGGVDEKLNGSRDSEDWSWGNWGPPELPLKTQ